MILRYWIILGRISNRSLGSDTLFGARNTGSAFVEASASVSEFLDPIVYSSHPFVQSLNERMSSTGSEYDLTNNSAIFNSFPEWITDEDETARCWNIILFISDNSRIF